MNPTIRSKCLLVLGMFLLPLPVLADDLATLQAEVDQYLSAAMMSDVDDLLSSYSAMKIGQTYTMDSPVMGPVTGDGNADSTWKSMSYNDATASKLIGYASDQCGSHTSYDQLVAKGVKVDQARFNTVRDKFCKLVHAAAELKHRYDKYQAIKTNGIVLVKRAKSQEHNFAGKHRTFGGGIDLIYKPDIAGTLENGLHLDETLIYNSWVKWSDDAKTPLNIVKRIREMGNSSAGGCSGPSFQVIDAGVRAYLYVDVVAVTSSKVTIKNCVKAVWNGDHGTHSFPEVSMTAPFGYLYELEQMKDGAKAKLKDKIKDKVVSMIGANQQMVTLLQKLH